MSAEHEVPFPKQLPDLLRMLADPVTPHTTSELWCRIKGTGWDQCVPVLLSELESGEADVKRLVLAIISEDAEQVGRDSVQPFVPLLTARLNDTDRLVRMEAIQAVRIVQVADQTTTEALLKVACYDEPGLAREALLTLLELDESMFAEVVRFLRSRSE